MPKEVAFVGPRQIEVREYQDRAPGPREVKVRVLYSGISHGTEMSHYRHEAIWHLKKVEGDGFITEGRSMSYPFTYGYEDVVRVEEVGAEVSQARPGEVYVCHAHHRETRILNVDRVNVSVGEGMFVRVPEDDPDLEKYVSVSLGTVALDGILTGVVHLGSSVVVVGQGVLGLLATQLCKLSGADPVIAIDLMDRRLKLALSLGADYALNPRSGDPGLEVRRILGGHGADVCLECSGKTAGIGLALHCGTPYPKVVAIGMYDGPASDLFLGEEFCRSYGQILHSRAGASRLMPEVPFGGMYHRRWNNVRLNEVIIKLMHRGKLRTDGLISHRFPLEKAKAAFQLIDEHPEQVTQVIFDLVSKPA